MKPKPKRSAPDLARLRADFQDAVKVAYQEHDAYWWDYLSVFLFHDPAIRARFMLPLGCWVLEKLRTSRDVLPADLCALLELKPGSTIATAVRKLKADMPTPAELAEPGD